MVLILQKKIADVSAGKNIFIKSFKKSDNKSEFLNPQLIRFIKSYDILKNEIIHENDINNDLLESFEYDNSFDFIKYELKRNDIIIANRSFSEFKASIIDFNINKIYISSNFLVIRPKHDEINPFFLLFYLNKPSTQASLIEKITKNKPSSNDRKTTVPKMLKISDIPVNFYPPPLEEQNKIVADILADIQKVKELENSITEKKALVNLS